MDSSTKFLEPRTLASLQGLELRARHIVEGYVAGMHHSPYHGFSIEFAEHREYVPGDDLRYVDWKAYGKTDKYYLKQYEEETNLVCYVLLDVSRSMQYRGPGAALGKLEYAQCLAAAISYLVLRQQDSVGLATFDRQVRSFVRPSGNPSHLKQLLHVMETTPVDDKTNIGRVFHDLAERLKKRGVVIVISDFFDDLPGLLTGLKHFRHRRHDVIAMHVMDPAELEFPFQDLTLFQGLEQEPDLLAEPRALREAYLEELESFTRQLREGCRANQVDYTRIRTDQRLDLALSSFLASRNLRLK